MISDLKIPLLASSLLTRTMITLRYFIQVEHCPIMVSKVFYEDSNPNGRPTHFNFITPSMTTLSSKNPAYRIYTIDGGYEGASYVSACIILLMMKS